MFSHHYRTDALVPANVEQVFTYADDQTRMSSHMSKSSWAMGGGRMHIEVDGGKGQCIGSHIQLSGRVFGINLFVDEIVTERTPPYRKVWQTIGKPRLLVIGRYQMGFEVQPRENDSQIQVFIDYDLPDGPFGRPLGYLFAEYYAKWCTRKMAQDAATHFASQASSARA
jgi:hypothetical protein